MAGALCGAYIGEAGIPEKFLAGLPGRRELGEAAEGLLSLARREG